MSLQGGIEHLKLYLMLANIVKLLTYGLLAVLLHNY